MRKGPNSSTEKASFKLIDEILKSINNKHLVGGIFCDLKKAFYCVSHDILIKKVVLWNNWKIRCFNQVLPQGKISKSKS
jgi:hypothetical protein